MSIYLEAGNIPPATDKAISFTQLSGKVMPTSCCEKISTFILNYHYSSSRIFSCKPCHSVPCFNSGCLRLAAIRRSRYFLNHSIFIMKRTILLSKLMHLSWEIQKRKPHALKQKQERGHHQQSIRSLAVEAAWVILQTEDITIYHLAKRHSQSKKQVNINTRSLILFQ